MPKSFLGDLRMHSLKSTIGRVGMAQVVEPHPRQVLHSGHHVVEIVSEAVRQSRFPVLAAAAPGYRRTGEYRPAAAPLRCSRFRRRKLFDREAGKRDRPCPIGLRCVEPECQLLVCSRLSITRSAPRSRSTFRQRSARISPRRIPVVSARRDRPIYASARGRFQKAPPLLGWSIDISLALDLRQSQDRWPGCAQAPAVLDGTAQGGLENVVDVPTGPRRKPPGRVIARELWRQVLCACWLGSA